MIVTSTFILDGLGIAAIVGASVVTFFSSTSKQTKADQRELINTIQQQRDEDRVIFNKRLTDLEDQRKRDAVSIARLEGQVQAYKDIPLGTIASSMEKIAASNDQILSTLKSSAVIAATDRNVLVSPRGTSHNQLVQEQVVEHQTVKGA